MTNLETFRKLNRLERRQRQMDEVDLAKTKSLKKWFNIHKELTHKQHQLLAFLLHKYPKQPTVKTAKKHWLYAISNGEELKLGFSKNPKQRLLDLQTATTKKLSLIWQYPLGPCQAIQAQIIEKRLHELCKAHRIRGEWFHKGAENLLHEFRCTGPLPAENNQTDVQTPENGISPSILKD